ncbi:MAG TPA: helix-turn-helix transcriptional regulator [Acidimicrobiales bacterium]|nr:helix-turn-helix transcriptional regulator [Acidimicrobiales bacterium]
MNAAIKGDTGAVIRLAREAQGRSQADLGAACGYSQPVVSRIERGQRHAYDIRILRRFAQVLDIPPQLLGLSGPLDGVTEPPMNRRDFLAGTAGVVASTLLPAIPAPSTETVADALRLVTATQRRLDGTMPSRDLAEPVLAHLRMTGRAVTTAADLDTRTDLAAALSEIAGFAGWLHWDMYDLGSARRYYDVAITSAHNAHDRLLGAYMTGSLAAFAAELGDTPEALTLLAAAHQQLGTNPPAIAIAWLSAVGALAHASAHDERAALAALEHSQAAVEQQAGESPPWPWVFAFDSARVAAYRLASTVRLGQTDTAVRAAYDAGPLLAAPTRQAALWRLDHADAHLQAGEVDYAFTIATDVLDTSPAQHSARIVNRARALRRGYAGHNPPSAVRRFDERISAASA